ncbi:hypothetical protein F6B41_06155 [Microbacterium lushaniae]|nr:hypothetical protein F6B41_33165 [Microbacterium lushaniae]KAA9157406.1 hypothetical protein F6B41_06155 [Microbacterium lushaniae]
MVGSLPRERTMLRRERGTRTFIVVVVICCAIAVALNVTLFTIGRVTGASLRVDPRWGDPDHLVIIADVVWKTLVPLVLGAIVLGLIAPRSRRWTTITIVAGSLVAGVSIPLVATGAHDLPTAAVLSGMHTVTGLAYVAIGISAHRQFARTGRA